MVLGDTVRSTMKCVVIGGSGFIGSRLLPELVSEYDLLNIDLVESPRWPNLYRRGDVRSLATFQSELAGADSVVLLAAEHRDDVRPSSLYFDVNVDGMRNVLAAMDFHRVRRIVFTSTVAVYGLEQPTSPTELSVVNPFNDYGRSKLDAEKILADWTRKGEGRSSLILRPTVVFGEGNRGNVYNLFRQIHRGRFLMIGTGTNRKSMAYVGNLVAFIRYMLNKRWDGLEVFNYVDPPNFDMNSLVGEFHQHFGTSNFRVRIPYEIGIVAGTIFDVVAIATRRRFPISAVRVRKFCADTIVDAGKLNCTGFIRPFTLRDGLKKVFEADFEKIKRRTSL